MKIETFNWVDLDKKTFNWVDLDKKHGSIHIGIDGATGEERTVSVGFKEDGTGKIYLLALETERGEE